MVIKKKNTKHKLIIATSSRALFDLSVSHNIFEKEGLKAFTKHQKENENKILKQGVGFNMIKKLLKLNSDNTPIDVILLSRNSVETGTRVFNSIDNYGLNIVRAAFTSGAHVNDYLKAFNADLFLSSDSDEVRKALQSGFAAANIVAAKISKKNNSQLRIAFDGDAVIFSDEAEKIFQEKGLEAFESSEKKLQNVPLQPGPFKAFLEALQKIQSSFPEENNPIRTALVTARSTITQKRIIHTMAKWGIRIDESFFLGGLDKGKILQTFNADIFFDDQYKHCQSSKDLVATAHVITGITNKK